MTRLLGLVAALALLAAGCTAPASPSGSPATPTRTLTVFAAASLRGAFTQLGADFASAHPGVVVRFSFGGSNGLVDQLQAGAPADVLASADEVTYARAHEAGLVTPGTLCATNALTLVVAPGNPTRIAGLDTLAGRKLVVCAVGVPCGNATAALARDAGVPLAPVSREQSVTDVLGKVISGEADAGIVYATDARAAGEKVTTVTLPGADAHLNRYPVGTTATAAHPELARAFVDHVTGPQGRAVLTSFGFGTP